MSAEAADHEFSFFCQYDACGARAPSIHELRVAIASLEVPVEGGCTDGFIRYSTVYGCQDCGSNINIKSPDRGVQANIRVKQISTDEKCLLFIGDEGLWYQGTDLLTGHDLPDIPAWTEMDSKIFDEVYDYETQFLRYGDEREGVKPGTEEDPYVTIQDLSSVAGLQRLHTNGGTTLQYFTPNFSFTCLYEYSPYWNLSTSFVAPAESDDSGADDDSSVVFHMQQHAERQKRGRSADRSPMINRTPSPLPKRKALAQDDKLKVG